MPVFLLPDHVGGFQPVQLGHLDIHQNQVEPALNEQPVSCLSIVRQIYRPTLASCWALRPTEVACTLNNSSTLILSYSSVGVPMLGRCQATQPADCQNS